MMAELLLTAALASRPASHDGESKKIAAQMFIEFLHKTAPESDFVFVPPNVRLSGPFFRLPFTFDGRQVYEVKLRRAA